MLDPWSSMESSNSPITDSGPSASEDCSPSTSSDGPGPAHDAFSPLPAAARCNQKTVSSIDGTKANPSRNDHCPNGKSIPSRKTDDKARARDFRLDLDALDPDPNGPRKRHFLDDDFQQPLRSNVDACRIPKPHFLDHSPSPDEFDERSDITNPNFLDDDVIEGGDDALQNAQRRAGALPKRPQRAQSSHYPGEEERPHRSQYRSQLHYGLERAARSSERDKRASQLYRGTWPGERDAWPTPDTASVRSFSSTGSTEPPRPSSNLENKVECVYSLLSLLSLSPDNNADLSGPLLEMSRSVESCVAMRQSGCIPLLVQLIHSKMARETRDRAARALRNIIHTQTDDKSGRREARVWRLLEQVREYCYTLEDVIESRKEDKELIEDDTSKHPSQSVAALMKLSFDEEHRHVVCQLGGLQALAALVSGDQAAHGSHAEDNTCLTMRKYAGMTLTNLTFGDGNNKSLLCSFKDFMLALVEQLESPNDDMRQVTAAVLRNLSWRADSNSKQVLREVDAVKGLTCAAMTCQKEATLKSVLSALWNLTAHCSMNKVALSSVDGALGFLVDMLSFNSPTKTLAIVENAGGIMRNVSSHIAIREDYRQILRERNCLSVLLQHLKSPSLTVVSNSCGTLWNLSARCPQDQQFLWDQGAVPMLRSLIHSKHKMIAMGSSAALKNLLNSKPGKNHIISLDSTAKSMNLPVLPTLGVRKQKALEQEIDQNLAETCDNIEPATSPSTSNREEKNLFSATERQIAMNLERHRMTSSSPLMGNLASQTSLSHSAHMASYLSCSNTLLKGSIVSRSVTGGSAGNVNRSDSKDSVTSTRSDSAFEKVMRTGKVPIPTPRSKDVIKNEGSNDAFKTPTTEYSEPVPKDELYLRYQTQPPVPPPRSTTDLRTNYTESGYDVDQDSCDQPIDYSRKYSETKSIEPQSEPTFDEEKSNQNHNPKIRPPPTEPVSKKYAKKESPGNYGDYQETDLDQPTDYSLRYAEHQSETSSDISEPPGPSIHEDTIKHFCTEGTPYETPVIFSTATSMSDLRVIGAKDPKVGKPQSNVKVNPEVMTQSDEKDTCSIEEPMRHDNDVAITSRTQVNPQKLDDDKPSTQFDTKFSSGMISPEKPVNYCEEGTPGYFSRVSSLSSLGDPTEEDSLAKKNALATINMDNHLPEQSSSGSVRDKESSKAVTFASEPVAISSQAETPSASSVRTTSPPAQGFIEDTPLMFSRTSSLGSLSGCEPPDDHGSVVSEISRLTSGCISPSEIPDSPGQSIPQSPRTRRAAAMAASDAPRTPPHDEGVASVFEERVCTFCVEHTPAHFSLATSLSSLTVDTESKATMHSRDPLEDEIPKNELSSLEVSSGTPAAEPRNSEVPELHFPDRATNRSRAVKSAAVEESQGTGDTCRAYCTEDTPAILSKAGSNSELSVLSMETRPEPVHDASTDSSNLSDCGENLLEECIQKGIAKVVKNGSQASEPALGIVGGQHLARDDLYRSLPPYLRSSTEPVKLSAEPARPRSGTVERDIASSRSQSPPPLPPKWSARAAPPRPPPPDSPPLSLGSDDERLLQHAISRGIHNLSKDHKRESRLPVKAQQKTVRDKPKPFTTSNLVRNDSLSSLSIDSFGSTDREIFEECVKAGLSKVNPRAKYLSESTKAHSVERTPETARHPTHRSHKSLDRNDKTSQPKHFDKGVASDSSKFNTKLKKKSEGDFTGMTRSPYSYHGDTAAQSLSHHSRWGVRSHNRFYDDGPPSLPARIDAQPRIIERSNSLSSLSNDSFGSTDKEVFERSVRMGMAKVAPKKKEQEKVKVRTDLEVRDFNRSRRRRAEIKPQPGALDKMLGDEYSRDRAILEEMIARGAGELKSPIQSKNVPAPSVARAPADGSAGPALPLRSGSDLLEPHDSAFNTTDELNLTGESESNNELDRSNELPTVDSGNTTFESADAMDVSNEFMAQKSANTTLESEMKDELERSNESYADGLDGSWSDFGSPPKHYDPGTLTRSKTKAFKPEWADINVNTEKVSDALDSKKDIDTWNDNTCPDDITFPTISGSVPMVNSFKSEAADVSTALPDLLEESQFSHRSCLGPDLTDQLDEEHAALHKTSPNADQDRKSKATENKFLLDNIREPSFVSLADEVDPKLDSMVSSFAIEKEAARLAAQLKRTQYDSPMINSVTSINSLDLDNVKPPSNMGSLLSLTQSASGQWEDNSVQFSRRTPQRSRKKSLPVALMVKRALCNSTHQGSTEHLDSNHVSFLDNVKPPSEMENLDMESSMISVSSIVSEVVDAQRDRMPVFDLNQPVLEFPIFSNFNNLLHDLDGVNPPSLFEEMAESTLEMELTTAQQAYEDCLSNTLNIITDLPSGSETGTPLPSDMSSVESTPKRIRGPKYITPKERRQISKERYQTYTIADTVKTEDVTLEVENNEFLTWVKSESDSKSDEYVTASSEPKSKRKLSAKQRRQEDRARYQTQTVNISSILANGVTAGEHNDPQIENLKQRLAARKTIKQKRLEDAERFRTRTLSEDIPPSPTYVTKDGSFENVETTTGYDSLSSTELNHQQLADSRLRGSADFLGTDAQNIDSGNNDDDFELNTTQMQTYTKSFRNYLPVIESPAAVDLCIVNNLKNIEMTASYQKTSQAANIEVTNQNYPSSSDFASLEEHSISRRESLEQVYKSESESDVPLVRVKPKIVKPSETQSHEDSLESNESFENDQGSPKAIRGRRKALYVSPYRRSVPPAKKPIVAVMSKPTSSPKVATITKVSNNTAKPGIAIKNASKVQVASKIPSTNTSPKKTIPNKTTPLKIAQKSITIPLVAVKPLPIERQGTFTKEDSTVLPKEVPVLAKRSVVPARLSKTTTPQKLNVNTSPSRLPQPRSVPAKSGVRRVVSGEVATRAPGKRNVNASANRASLPAMKSSASNQSLQSNDSGKTVTLSSRMASRHGSASSVNSVSSPKGNAKDVESKIASLWKKVEQTKKQTNKSDRRVWIGTEETVEKPKLIRSSTFEGQPKQAQAVATPKQKSSIAIRVSQIPSSRYGARTASSRTPSQIPGGAKKTASKVFVRKQLNGQQIAT